MGRIINGINWLIGGVRAFVAGIFATIFVLILFPTITSLAGVLSYGVWMLFHAEFYTLVLMLTAILGVATLIAKAIVPDITVSE